MSACISDDIAAVSLQAERGACPPELFDTRHSFASMMDAFEGLLAEVGVGMNLFQHAVFSDKCAPAEMCLKTFSIQKSTWPPSINEMLRRSFGVYSESVDGALRDFPVSSAGRLSGIGAPSLIQAPALRAIAAPQRTGTSQRGRSKFELPASVPCSSRGPV